MVSRAVDVLLIEDNPGDARLIHEYLQGAHGEFALTRAGTVAKGLEELESRRVDVVLLDLSLPDSHGLDTFERIHQAVPSVPIVVLSGLSDEETALAAVRSGAQDYLVKGHVDEDLLGRAIHYAIERQRLEDAQRFLARASRILAGSLDFETTLQRIAELAIPVLADRCLIDLTDGAGLHQAAAAALHSSQVEALRAFRRDFPIRLDDARSPIARAVASQSPQVLADLSPEVLADTTSGGDHVVAGARLVIRSAMIAPLVVRERVLGAITFLSVESRRVYESADYDLALNLAQRAALAIDNAQLYQQARDAVRVRDLVLSSVAHDLRGPLTPIKLAGETLRWQVERGESADTAAILEGLRSIDLNVDKMTSQIDELLDVARLQMGRELLRLHRRRLDLVPVIRAQVKDYQSRAHRHRIRFDPEGESIVAWIDLPRYERVIGNLLSNAIKYSPGGGEIAVRARQTGGPDDGWAVVEIQDQGVGIAADDLPRLFGWFFRSERVAKEFPGTGIGLAGSFRIVELHGGGITVQSVEGAGSTFTVQIPRGPPRIEEPPEEIKGTAARQEPERSTGEPPRW